jgi:hypothetical protein
MLNYQRVSLTQRQFLLVSLQTCGPFLALCPVIASKKIHGAPRTMAVHLSKWIISILYREKTLVIYGISPVTYVYNIHIIYIYNYININIYIYIAYIYIWVMLYIWFINHFQRWMHVQVLTQPRLFLSTTSAGGKRGPSWNWIAGNCWGFQTKVLDTAPQKHGQSLARATLW